MATYNIIWKNSAKKELKKIDKKEILTILNEIEKLSTNPYPQNHKKLTATENIFRIRVRSYRVIYRVENSELIIEIVRVRHRKEVYKNFP